MDNPYYVTVVEAENKRCVEAPDVWYCHGPECMAWRWKEEDYLAKIENSNISIDVVKQRYSTTHGYCGMVRNQ